MGSVKGKWGLWREGLKRLYEKRKKRKDWIRDDREERWIWWDGWNYGCERYWWSFCRKVRFLNRMEKRKRGEKELGWNSGKDKKYWKKGRRRRKDWRNILEIEGVWEKIYLDGFKVNEN